MFATVNLGLDKSLKVKLLPLLSVTLYISIISFILDLFFRYA
ncbi:hypothetical protein [uncultured Gammaproteobacteria bacterium]|nr:hypothetical protein [uncultured Gammaproteobacteria bacterium]